ncbi:leucine-rich repeat protein, partial [Vibrio sp. FNV 38]|nr:leucine-rich repeat protein [Vibrio sp. FNV 38]
MTVEDLMRARAYGLFGENDPMNGEYRFFDYLGMPNLYTNGYKVKRIIIGEGITGIGAYYFAQTDVESVSVPSSVTWIGTGAFADCYSLTEIDASDEIREEIEASIRINEYEQPDDG